MDHDGEVTLFNPRILADYVIDSSTLLNDLKLKDLKNVASIKNAAYYLGLNPSL